MTARVAVTPAANADIDDIWEFVWRGNPTAADGIIGKVYDVFEALAENPRMGPIRDELRGKLRSFPISGTPFVVFYRPSRDGITVLRVIHASRDIERVY